MHARMAEAWSWITGYGGTAILLVTLCGSLALNIKLGWAARGAAAPPPSVGRVLISSTLSPLSVSTLDGAQARIAFDGRKPTVVYVISPSCVWCTRNAANIAFLAQSKRADYTFVGISQRASAAVLREYLTQHPLPFPVYLLDNTTSASLALGTPSTLVVAPGGKVVAGWGGAYLGDKVARIQEFFGVQLPGLTEQALQP